jgi:DNA-binding transcriptional LysR family regulator
VRSAVISGYGITFLSRSAVEAELASGRVAEARVRGLNLVRDVSLVRAVRRAPTRVAEAFVAFAKERVT